ncbi:thioredoxin-domain-containing protein [Vararia minispora EC-137]|uniref:Thioredoxin-domain-containing protein n=1 Tax=Vararia minispora EC-137 TaxID=1314806 RepID=A0ACB8QD94_9AGAM|nr:thioredoxin-domain-containing protein [Vararia minispora EC-137]
MRWLWPSRLPCSLLLATLALSAPVQGVEKLVLTPENFQRTIAEGYWFIEHFSPWCGHCQQFMPLWEELVEAYKGSPVHLAQVDCSVNGDLCNAHGVSGYPTMNMYKDGKGIGKFEGARTRARLDDYITDKTSVSLRAAIPAQDASAAPTLVDLNPLGEVLSLDEKTFARAVQEGNMFVKFFAPWCGHCKKLAPMWTDLARAMQHKLKVAEVNCETHKALCTKEGVTGFPMLFFYPPGGSEKTEYTGGRKLEAMKAWADRATKPPLQHLSYDDLENVVNDHAALYLFLHTPNDTKQLTVVYNAARPLLGSPPVYTSSSQQFLDRFGLSATATPILLAIKDHDVSTPTSVLRITDNTTLVELEQWMLAHRLPSALELSELSFQEVMKARARPLVVLTSVPAATNFAEYEWLVGETTKIAMKWRELTLQRGSTRRSVVFVWMDAEKWSKWLKSMYGIQGPNRVVIADHKDLLYYDTTPDGKRLELTPESIFPSLEAAQSGKLRAKYSENFVERVARTTNGIFMRIERFILENSVLFAFFAFAGVIATIAFIRRILATDAVAYSQQEKGRLD